MMTEIAIKLIEESGTSEGIGSADEPLTRININRITNKR